MLLFLILTSSDSLSPERCQEFLESYMNQALISAAGQEMLQQNISYALDARRTFPWAKDVPDDLFLHYVLPIVMSQEPPEAWRPLFFDSLKLFLEGVDDPVQAALAINRWCAQRVKYKPTQRRDQGPLETLKSGFGRCEEETIVFVDALRAVGIPARQAYTPWWPFTNSNHAWTELFVNGKWFYAGSCEPKDSLNKAWFSSPVKRTAVVFSVVPGHLDTGEVYRQGSDYTIINSTGNYRDVSRLVVSGLNPGDTMGLSVFNYGALRPVMKLASDSSGTVSCSVGPGDYVITGPDFAQLIQVRGDTTRYQVKPGARLSEAGFWMRSKEPLQ